MELKVKELSNEIWEDVVRFFNHNGSNSGCWCMNHRMDPDKVVEGAPAKDLLSSGISEGSVNGLLFYDNDLPIGWCAIDPVSNLIGHDCFQKEENYLPSDWSIHCLCLAKEYRGKGIEKQMLAFAEEYLKMKGASRVMAFPEPKSEPDKPFTTWNIFCGYESDYIEAGFKKLETNNPNYSQCEKRYVN